MVKFSIYLNRSVFVRHKRKENIPWIHLVDFSTFFDKGDNFYNVLVCFPVHQSPTEKGSTINRRKKHFLNGAFQKIGKIIKTELLPLKVYTFL